MSECDRTDSAKNETDVKVNTKWLKRTARILVFLGVLFINFIPGGLFLSGSPTNESILLFHIGFTFLWWGALFGLAYYRTLYFAKLPLKQEPQNDAIKAEKYTLSIENLLSRCDNLDKTLSGLRSGTGVILGIATAVFVWILSYSQLPIPIQQILLVGSGMFLFMSVVAILLSFTSQSLRTVGVQIGEGLIPIASTETEYRNQLEEVIGAKEDVLQSIRTSVGIGLFVFVILTSLSIFVPQYSILMTIGEMGTNYIQDAEYIMFAIFYSFSATGLFAFFFSLAIYVLDRPVLGLLDTKELQTRADLYISHFKEPSIADQQNGETSKI